MYVARVLAVTDLDQDATLGMDHEGVLEGRDLLLAGRESIPVALSAHVRGTSISCDGS